jgi:hypothetical protein
MDLTKEGRATVFLWWEYWWARQHVVLLSSVAHLRDLVWEKILSGEPWKVPLDLTTCGERTANGGLAHIEARFNHSKNPRRSC